MNFEFRENLQIQLQLTVYRNPAHLAKKIYIVITVILGSWITKYPQPFLVRPIRQFMECTFDSFPLQNILQGITILNLKTFNNGPCTDETE